MTIDLEAIKAAALAVLPEFGGEWSASADNIFLHNDDGHIVSKLADVRGWGYLTGAGGGCRRMAEQDASAKQDALARYLVDMHPQTTLALVERVEEMEARMQCVLGVASQCEAIQMDEIAKRIRDAAEGLPT